jgi:HlyD family secretion protein
MATMSRRSLIGFGVLIAVLLGVAAAWFGRAPAAGAVEVQSAPLLRTLQFSGRVATLSRVEIGSTVTARVATVTVREGDPVARGALLLQLEDEEVRAALAQAEAGERQAAARLAGLAGSGRESADAAVAQADAQRAAAEATRGRTADLVARGFVGQAQLDEAERALAVARAQRDAALAQRRALDARGSEVVQAEAQLALARAATAAAHARLAQSRITAPAGARVLVRAVEPGQIVQPGRALLTLALTGPLELLAQVDERFLEELQIGQTATVVADAYPQQRFEATLARIGPLVDAQRGSIELRFAPAAAPSFLREDMTLSLEVTTARRERTRVIPLAALRGGDVVWIARDGRVEARTLKLGLRTVLAVEVLEGLADGEAVLVGDAPAPGARVRPVPADAAAVAGQGGGGAAALTQAMGR